MGRILTLIAGAVLVYVGSGYLEGFLKGTEEEKEETEKAEA